MSADQQFTAAILACWDGSLDFVALVNQANALENAGLKPLAIVLYQTWLLCNLDSPYAHVVNFNLGVGLSKQGNDLAAIEAYRTAADLSPKFAQPRLNLGLLYERLGRIEDALLEWRWIVHTLSLDTSQETRQMVVSALNHLGRVLEMQKRYDEALQCLNKSLLIDPAQPDVLHHWVYLRQKQCIWPVYDEIGQVRRDFMEASTSALAMISLTDDPALQLAAARRYVAKKVASDVPRLAPEKGYGHRRLRLGYLSSDFCLHPVSMLTVELYELHDRERFEIYGYCWSPEDGSAMRQRVIGAMDHFHRIHGLSDEAAARLIRSHEIDILIDLQGQTAGARANLLAYRPASIQITYLGLPATTGLPSIDYVIADRFLIPESLAAHYSEKPIYMPDVYQVSDRKRLLGALPTRESCGLPADAFVFCSFNNNFKYTPEMFAAWMRILARVPGSVLWLLADNPWAEENLRREAIACGIGAERLIFAKRIAPENYLARYAIADLFLDSFPFNAGTTANDALWMGLPVLTLSGRAFASRMAGALLTAAGLPELITEQLPDYEEKAVALAQNRSHCQALRAYLLAQRENGALFDSPRFVRNLEAALLQLIPPGNA